MRYAYQLISGTRRDPRGWMGSYHSKAEAEANRTTDCYIVRVATEEPHWEALRRHPGGRLRCRELEPGTLGRQADYQWCTCPVGEVER